MRINVLRGLFWTGIVSAMLVSGAALAGQNQGGNEGGNAQGDRPRAVPEFDSAAIGVVAVLVTGGGVLLARRRRGN